MTRYDVLIIGGGPTGATLAARLAQKGVRVGVLEQEQFPRFHIGESLLPCSMPMFEALGVAKRLEHAGFLKKHAAEFVTGDGSLRRRYPFAEGVVPGPGYAYEVERSELDQILLEHAASLGADVQQGVEVHSVQLDGVPRIAAERHGEPLSFEAEVVVDATGQRALLASQLKLKRMDPDLKNVAMFSHYEGAGRATGDAEGDISIVLAPQGWWWVIPLANDKTSLGLVAPRRAFGEAKLGQAVLEAELERTPYLKQRFADARRIAPVRTISDYSFVASRFAGERWILAGDAAAFIDPVFSTGVYLGMSGAFRIADTLEKALTKRRFHESSWRPYTGWLKRAVRTYSSFVKGFYTPEFAEVMMHPSDRLELRQAVTSLLSGRGTDCFPVTWRIWIFRAIVRANQSWPLTPRLEDRRRAHSIA